VALNNIKPTNHLGKMNIKQLKTIWHMLCLSLFSFSFIVNGQPQIVPNGGCI
jgi:hypothetical protein